MPLGPGSRLDAYELLQPLGAGGMGEVWLATEVRLGRKLALKLLPSDLTRDPARVSRFEQEARAASALSHPNVCTILALGETPDGQHYIAMEYVDGETLRKRIAGGRHSIREAVDIAVQIASALVAAHAAGIVHRDIKPENVIVRPDGFVKVLDFGLAKLTAAAESTAVEATQTAFCTDAGTVVGTVAGGPCRNPATITVLDITTTIPCGQHQPRDRQCPPCQVTVTERHITTEFMGHHGPQHPTTDAGVAA